MDELTFGQRLVHYRNRTGLLQKELAAKAGVTPTALNYYEKDKREPNVLNIIQIAKALGVTGDELLGISTDESNTNAHTKDEIKLLSSYRSLNQQGKEYIRQTLEMAVLQYKKDNFIPNMETTDGVG